MVGMSGCGTDGAGSGHCDAVHWLVEGQDEDLQLVWSTRSCGCGPEHLFETVYWGVSYAPLTEWTTDPCIQGNRTGRPWLWFMAYRGQPSDFSWYPTRPEAEAQGLALEAEAAEHSGGFVRCDRAAADYDRFYLDQERTIEESRREYHAWKRGIDLQATR